MGLRPSARASRARGAPLLHSVSKVLTRMWQTMIFTEQFWIYFVRLATSVSQQGDKVLRFLQGFRWHLGQYRMKRFSGRERWVSEVLACRSVRGHVTRGIFKIALSKCNFLPSLEKKWLTGKVFYGIIKCLLANKWKIETIFTLN